MPPLGQVRQRQNGSTTLALVLRRVRPVSKCESCLTAAAASAGNQRIAYRQESKRAHHPDAGDRILAQPHRLWSGPTGISGLIQANPATPAASPRKTASTACTLDPTIAHSPARPKQSL